MSPSSKQPKQGAGAARESRADERVFRLNEAQSLAFAELLANPPPPNAKLRALMASKAPWE